MPDIRHKQVSQEEAVRVVERDPVQAPDVQELERRLNGLQNDIAQLANLALSGRSQNQDPYLRVPQPSYFGALNRFGPVVPGAVPPPQPAHPGAPLLGYGVRSYGINPEAVTMRDFNQTPPVTRPPGVNIVDAGESYVVQVELPAIKKEDLEILGSDRSITVAAQVRPDPATEGTVLLGEVAPTIYRRTIHLPAACSTARSKATLKDGILTLHVPKKDPSSGMRRIDVAYG